MTKVRLSQCTCEMIYKVIKEKQLTYEDVAKLVDSSASTICRICRGKSKNINSDLIEKLEIMLNIRIDNVLDETTELIKRIESLEEENKLLKQLLIDKWKQ